MYLCITAMERWRDESRSNWRTQSMAGGWWSQRNDQKVYLISIDLSVPSSLPSSNRDCSLVYSIFLLMSNAIEGKRKLYSICRIRNMIYNCIVSFFYILSFQWNWTKLKSSLLKECVKLTMLICFYVARYFNLIMYSVSVIPNANFWGKLCKVYEIKLVLIL